MKFIQLILTGMFAIIVSINAASALDLDEARAKKLVSEQPNGFIKANDSSAKSLESEINAKRKEAYEKIFKENGGRMTMDQIAEQAAKKIQERMNEKK